MRLHNRISDEGGKIVVIDVLVLNQPALVIVCGAEGSCCAKQNANRCRGSKQPEVSKRACISLTLTSRFLRIFTDHSQSDRASLTEYNIIK